MTEISLARRLANDGFDPDQDFDARDDSDGEGPYLHAWLSDKPMPEYAREHYRPNKTAERIARAQEAALKRREAQRLAAVDSQAKSLLTILPNRRNDMKGYRSYIVAGLIAALGGLEQSGFVNVVPAGYEGLALALAAAAMIALRKLTTGPAAI